MVAVAFDSGPSNLYSRGKGSNKEMAVGVAAEISAQMEFSLLTSLAPLTAMGATTQP